MQYTNNSGRPKQLMTLCVVYNDTHVLLGMKKRGLGEGKWNGFGGKMQEGETLEAAVKRELHEEAGVMPLDLEKRGMLYFDIEGYPSFLEVYVFSASRLEGEPQESEEMRPQWFSRNEIPFHAMWADDCHWLPLLLAGKNFEGNFHFRDYETITEYEVKEV